MENIDYWIDLFFPFTSYTNDEKRTIKYMITILKNKKNSTIEEIEEIVMNSEIPAQTILDILCKNKIRYDNKIIPLLIKKGAVLSTQNWQDIFDMNMDIYNPCSPIYNNHEIHYENGAIVTQQSFQKYAERLSQRGYRPKECIAGMTNLDKIKKCCENGAIFTQANWDTFAEHTFQQSNIYCEKHVKDLADLGCIITIKNWEDALDEEYSRGGEINEYVIIKCDELDIIKNKELYYDNYWQEALDKIMHNQHNYNDIKKLINICVKYGAVAK